MIAVLDQKEDFSMALIVLTTKVCSSRGSECRRGRPGRRGFQEADGGQVAGGERIGEVVDVVLVVGQVGGADRGNRVGRRWFGFAVLA